MDEEIDRLVVAVRADLGTFRRDVEAMRGALDGPLEAGAERAGRAIEGALGRAVRTGKLGFDDLKRVALSTMAEIASAAVRDGVGALIAGGGRGGGASGLAGALLALAGAPGRATGGPVGPGRAYLVGERGPELFVPTASGRVEPGVSRGGAREVRVAITVNAGPGVNGPEALTRSSRQVARAVQRALREE
ncbi:tail tape measure protein [Sphingomonas lenta]|uniref:Tail tape measure protein n=1 Tax=Sphingomonas lenta TaxID=1141887 RepID=A0A2A2SCN0_9SPHN|nr:tail tape measure protein [Sphingomonas lenta]PAX07009.1 tail tape measure protein [Sphingomonas lenta]